MRKTFILDTSVLVTDPSAYKHFPDSDIIIPITVLNELDNVKKHAGSSGKNARVAIRLIDDLIESKNINEGLSLDNGSVLYFDTEFRNTNIGAFQNLGDSTYGDTHILACLISIHTANELTTLVSNDINLRIKAKSRGIEAIGFTENGSVLSDIYAGVNEVVNPEIGEKLKTGSFNPKDYEWDLFPNEFVVLKDYDGKEIATGRKVNENKVRLTKQLHHWGINPRNKEQAFAMELIEDKSIDLVTLTGASGTGKTLCALASCLEMVLARKQYDKLVIYRPIQAVGGELGFAPGPQPLSAKIATPDGWTTMGELQIGSIVFGRDGKPTKVLGLFPKGEKEVYKVTTTDGTSTECCEDHLWYTQTKENIKRNKNGSVKTTKEIMDTLYNKKDKLNHYLPRNEAVEYSKKDLPIPPYVLGALIGDGSFGDAISMTSIDVEIIDRIKNELQSIDNFNYKKHNIGYNISIDSLYNNKPAKIVKITDLITGEEKIYNSIGIALKEIKINRSTLHHRCNDNKIVNNIKYEFGECPIRWQNTLKNEIYNLGLLGKKAWDKFIPNNYKYSSIDDRIALLQGLMDTDGTIKKSGEASFCNTSKQLCEDVIELVRSLGGRATLCERDRVGKKRNTKINGRDIVSRRISYEFTISMPNHINPFSLKRKAERHQTQYIIKPRIEKIEYIGKKEVQCILVDNDEHLYLTDNFIVTHNTIEEKLSPWFQAIDDSFEILFSSASNKKMDWRKELDMFKAKGKIEYAAMTYVRGRSIPKSIMLIDEFQNLTREDAKTLLTRAGEGTKIILTGDISQIDSKDLDAMNNGLTYVIDKFKDSELAGHVTFAKGERSRLATKAAEIL